VGPKPVPGACSEEEVREYAPRFKNVGSDTNRNNVEQNCRDRRELDRFGRPWATGREPSAAHGRGDKDRSGAAWIG